VRRIVHDHGDPGAPDAMLDIEAAIDVAGRPPAASPQRARRRSESFSGGFQHHLLLEQSQR
jgi:hypothetical protein